ncbi:MAG: precorrin-2 C(20)-methyltransferase [Geobacteraceae bacterium]|nr:precorrin-2 C(20)-methyltransferase [Geobacteraceae bacterium]
MTHQHQGIFYGVGIGPGDPELLTLKAVRVLQQCHAIYVPTSRVSRQTYVADVVDSYAGADCEIVPVTFSLADSGTRRQQHWHATAREIATRLHAGQDVAFVTLGDALLYSTYVYLLRALHEVFAQARVETVPGISAVSATAALCHCPLGEGEQPLTILPAAHDMEKLRALILGGSGVAIMKIGHRLTQVLELLAQCHVLERSVFVARVGLPEQRIETDLNRLRGAPADTGNLAVILVPPRCDEGDQVVTTAKKQL